jgi:hypothetical protein
MSPEQYDLFVAECDIKSREYTILKNSVVARNTQDGLLRRTIEILCDEDEAVQLLAAARQFYPDAAPTIAKSIELAHQS